MKHFHYLLLCVCISCAYNAKQDLIANYESKRLEINQLYGYVNNITTDDKAFAITFENNKKIASFDVSIKRIDPQTGHSSITNISADGNYNSYESNKNIDINSKNVDNLLSVLGWTRKELNTLKQKLDNANCISVENGNLENGQIGNPMTIGYKSVGFGFYFAEYKIFRQSLSDSLINKYLKNKNNDACKYFFYKDNVVLGYCGGFGP